jgi:hypothetical protein
MQNTWYDIQIEPYKNTVSKPLPKPFHAIVTNAQNCCKIRKYEQVRILSEQEITFQGEK